MRLGFLFPPCGGEHEIYLQGEALGDDVRVTLIGTRIFGEDDEHAPHHLSRTGAIDHLAMHARVLAHTSPDVAIWACTSGSFIDGLEHAKRQARTISEVAHCPASSTSLAFVAALQHLGIQKVALLASYPQVTATAFRNFLHEAGIEVGDFAWLSADSGPAAAEFGSQRLIDESAKLTVPKGGALLIPDTAMAVMDVIAPLEESLNCPVLTANQVSLWEAVRLAEGGCRRPGIGRLFAN